MLKASRCLEICRRISKISEDLVDWVSVPLLGTWCKVYQVFHGQRRGPLMYASLQTVYTQLFVQINCPPLWNTRNSDILLFNCCFNCFQSLLKNEESVCEHRLGSILNCFVLTEFPLLLGLFEIVLQFLMPVGSFK